MGEAVLGVRSESWSSELELEVGIRGRNRPLRGFATHREANTPSEASAEESVRRGQGSV